MSEDKQVKSKQRVAEHGEVFTAEREVKAMCDLVKQETERIESRFLEPACGNGNFLAEVLTRKLAVVAKRYTKSPSEYEKYAVLAISSLYGVDILPDNVQECQQRLLELWENAYQNALHQPADKQCQAIVQFILRKNILCGDALTLLQADGSPIVFAEWSMVTASGLVKRRDFTLHELLNGHRQQLSLDMLNWEFDEEVQAFIPSPVREYPLVDYRRLCDYE